MCGFGAELRRAGRRTRRARRDGDALAPRGPDGAGEGSAASALVHRRLKIIDLSERGAQPMHDPRHGLSIVFNGCIYNHHELRAELEGAGHSFRSTSDTEVLLEAGRSGARTCSGASHGMFAFACRGAHGRVALVRDRLGIKPLYLAEAGRRPARGVDAAGAARGRRRRHARRPGRAAPLPVLALGRAGAAHDPARRAQARRRRPC